MKYICNPINMEYKYQFNVRNEQVTINREAADPSMIEFKGKYYIFPSMTAGFLSSDDLTDWKFHSLKDVPIYDYAPDVRVIGEYIYFSASKIDHNCSFFRTKDPINGKFEEIEGTFPFWDPNLFVDDDGRVYFYWGCSNKTPIYGIELNPENMKPKCEPRALIFANQQEHGYERNGENHKPSKSPAEINEIINSYSSNTPDVTEDMINTIRMYFCDDKPYIEGAWMNKNKGKYYLQYACPGTEFNVYADGVYISDGPLGPFTLAQNNPYSYKPGGFISGAGHGSTMEDKLGNIWHVASMRISINDRFERRLGLWPAGYDENGELFCNQRYGDWPMKVEQKKMKLWNNPEWMLLSYNKPVIASSFEEGKEASKATDENVQTWWRAASNMSGEWIEVDLQHICEIYAIQLNFADDKLTLCIPEGAMLHGDEYTQRYIDESKHYTRWLLEGSIDGKEYFVIEDKQDADSDLSHDLIVKENGFRARYVKCTVKELPYNQSACISGLRIFGIGNGELPDKAIGVTLERLSELDLLAKWENMDSIGYNVLWGFAPDKLYHSYMVFSNNEVNIGALIKGHSVYVRVDTFNEKGITEGDVCKVEPYTIIKELVKQLTLQEKAGLCSGRDNWFTKGVERLDILPIRMSDGPHGLRTQSGEMSGFAQNCIPAVCYPLACATAASFDRELLRREGEIIGRECQSLGVQVILGPGANIKRSPLCGRNFEYFSEDPLVATEMATAFIQGVQNQGVGATIKHFFANNQEHRRMTNSSEVDERTLREIYLAAFEGAVKNAQPWAVMASYNKINGIFSTENTAYLQDILRNEWGFKGLVVSDWGATHNRTDAVAAGTDLTMPAAIETDVDLIKSVKDGTLDERKLDTACENILTMTYMGLEHRRANIEFDYIGGHSFAREAAGQSMVLLKNEESILPLKKSDKIAFIGKFASEPRYQGSGSSYINSFKVTSALDAAADAGITVEYVEGYSIKEDKTDVLLFAEAVATAKNADVAVIFAGLTEQMESEGFDRKHLNMPVCQNELIAAVCAVQPNTVVVLHNGAPIEMPWVHKPKAIIETYLGGQAIGAATVDVLWGAVNPSGRLAESFPKKLEDNPSYLFYFGEGNRVEYNEKVFVGYRYYESKNMETLFPFGYGLSYTTFEYANLKLNKIQMTDDDTLTVSVDVTNTGGVEGKEVVQLYVAPEKSEIIRPVRELKGFEKIKLRPGETKTVIFQLNKRAFAYWNVKIHAWYVESGTYCIQIGKSSHNIVCEEKVVISALEVPGYIEYNTNSTIGDFVRHPLGKKFWEENIGEFITGLIEQGMIKQEQLDSMDIQPGDKVTDEVIKKMTGNIGEQENGFSRMDVMMDLPVTLLLGFISGLSMQDLKLLFDVMNKSE